MLVCEHITTRNISPGNTDPIPGDSYVLIGQLTIKPGGKIRRGFEFGQLHVEAEYNLMRQPAPYLYSIILLR